MRVAAYDTGKRKSGDVYNPVLDVLEKAQDAALVGGIYPPNSTLLMPVASSVRLASGFIAVELWVKTEDVALFLKPKATAAKAAPKKR